MSASSEDRAMGEQGRVEDVEVLIREILRYLSYLDALRGKPPQRPAEEERK